MVESQTVLPREVRDRLRVGPDDHLRYLSDDSSVRIEKGWTHDIANAAMQRTAAKDPRTSVAHPVDPRGQDVQRVDVCSRSPEVPRMHPAYSHRGIVLLVACVLGLGVLQSREAAQAADDSELVLILDASGSMWGRVQEQPKIDVARRVLKDVLARAPATTAVGLVVYGHRSKTDCDDIETMVAAGSTDRTAVLRAVDSIQPKGKTPLANSIRKVVDLLRGRETASTVVLISDGIETCGGDVCKLVRDARAAGVKFVLHVVGFDMAKEDAAPLECAAQAGGGLYFTAASADELGAALDHAVAMTPETPSGKLSVRTTADGKLTDVLLTVSKSGTREVVTKSRTYTSTDSNPRILPLPDGTYDLAAAAVRISGTPIQELTGIEIRDGATVEKSLDFGTGRLRVKVTSNGELSDANVHVYRSGSRDVIASNRTYDTPANNPKDLRLPAGVYDVEISSVEISGKPKMRWEAVEVGGDVPVERHHDFATGTMRIGATSGGKLVDAVVSVAQHGDGQAVAQGRTYTSSTSNPKSFTLGPGKYVVTLSPVQPKKLQRAHIEIDLTASSTVERIVELTAAPAMP